jgi:protein-S-isoprenylcysteine O-methyltransferase Ste14
MLAGMVTAPSWASLSAFALFTAAAQVQVRLIEEPYLLRTRGAAYPACIGRFLPGPGRLHAEVATAQDHP